MDEKQNIDRKKDHIELAFQSSTNSFTKDNRFNYEPILCTHPEHGGRLEGYFAGKLIQAPIWVSSMTGGTQMAQKINTNLARACRDFGLGMGLGSCRKLLDSDEYLKDFDVRQFIGDQPLFANLGIAQINEQIESKSIDSIVELVKRLDADGLIIHINPIQEWLQPEGDLIRHLTPLQAITILLDKTDLKLIVKEVGQGMGPESLKELLNLPLTAVEFGAYGGTNFAKLESLRDPESDDFDPLCFVGHSAGEMINIIHEIGAKNDLQCTDFIVSGGIKNYLDGYYYNSKLKYNSIYGQAAGFLKHAREDYDRLARHVEKQIEGYRFAMRYLRIRNKS